MVDNKHEYSHILEVRIQKAKIVLNQLELQKLAAEKREQASQPSPEQLQAEKEQAMHAEIDALQKHLEDSELKLSQLQDVAEEAWHEIRDAIEHSWHSLSDYVKQLIDSVHSGKDDKGPKDGKEDR